MNKTLITLAVTSAVLCIGTFGCTMMESKQADSSSGATVKGIHLLNGIDLAGWEQIGGATWKVENGELIGTQGPGNAPGDLLTEASYKDFELHVTYKVDWPANTGVWFRYQSPKKAYQADILEYAKPVAYSGTIYCPGKLFLTINDNKELENKTGWNLLRVRAEGDHLQVWLNGHQVGDVRDSTTDHGKIGFQVHAGDQFAKMKITVREAVLYPIGEVMGSSK